MRRHELELSASQAFDLQGKRVLIFVVAGDATRTIANVLERIPLCLHDEAVEILVIDDCSADETFGKTLRRHAHRSPFKITLLRTPEKQGHGGTQKLGYRYAIDNGFDVVALLHDDRGNAPENLPELLTPLLRDEADAVFGSRMMNKDVARTAGMPWHRWLSNKVLSALQNRMLGSKLSEFRAGYRVFATRALAQLPFERNTNDFHFDSEILIQLLLKKMRILELPVPALCGGERTGMKYGLNVGKAMMRARLHQMNLFFDRKFDLTAPEEIYDAKLEFSSSHTAAIAAVWPGSHVLDLGCGHGYVGTELVKKGCRVTGMDRHPPKSGTGGMKSIAWELDRKEFPVNVSQFDQILMLDIIEHLKTPEAFMDELRFATGCKRPELLITTANIGFIATRLMLLFGQFNYGRKGILDATHTRLFTFRSMRELLQQCGYRILETRGIPAPYPKALGNNIFSRFLVRANEVLIKISRTVFSYQIYMRAQALPTVNNLLHETIAAAAAKPSLEDLQRSQQTFRHELV